MSELLGRIIEMGQRVAKGKTHYEDLTLLELTVQLQHQLEQRRFTMAILLHAGHA